VMMTVRELFSANAVIPFTFDSFCPRGYQDYANIAKILLGMIELFRNLKFQAPISNEIPNFNTQ
ncbi:MAG: hypothetical protein WBN03_14515, partial [Desulfobacterales bacterium]